MLPISLALITHISSVQFPSVKTTIPAAQVKVAKKPPKEVLFPLTNNVEADRQEVIRLTKECLEIPKAEFTLRQMSATNANSKTLFITQSSDDTLAPVLDNFPLIPVSPEKLPFLLEVSFPVTLGTSRDLNTQFNFGLTIKCIFPTN